MLCYFTGSRGKGTVEPFLALKEKLNYLKWDFPFPRDYRCEPPHPAFGFRFLFCFSVEGVASRMWHF
jgi:hypothetical protein